MEDSLIITLFRVIIESLDSKLFPGEESRSVEIDDPWLQVAGVPINYNNPSALGTLTIERGLRERNYTDDYEDSYLIFLPKALRYIKDCYESARKNEPLLDIRITLWSIAAHTVWRRVQIKIAGGIDITKEAPEVLLLRPEEILALHPGNIGLKEFEEAWKNEFNLRWKHSRQILLELTSENEAWARLLSKREVESWFIGRFAYMMCLGADESIAFLQNCAGYLRWKKVKYEKAQTPV